MIEKSTITCPFCRGMTTETIPITYSLLVWKCPNGDRVLRPKEGDCYVLCSYGDSPCLSNQKEKEIYKNK